MTATTIIGIVIVIALIIGVGILSSRKVRDARDFISGGGKAGSLFVCGSIMGSLVSSQATIGTAQLAFHYGLAAWWFTLGAGIGCLFLAVGYVRPLRQSGCVTELQIISREYGAPAGKLGSILCSIGIFISVLAQVVACVGLITILFPVIGIPAAALISVAIMAFYVIFGGSWGTGMGGVVKLVLLCAASVVGLLIVLIGGGGISGLWDSLNRQLAGTSLGLIQKTANHLGDLQTAADISHRFFNLTARGASTDLGSGLSLLLGVLSTQTYAQAVWSGKSDKVSRRGALVSACLIPPIGVAGIAVGLFMRTHFITQAEVNALTAAGLAVPQLPVLASTIQVFPAFLMHYLPHIGAGIFLGTLLITVVGGGAGLSLGMATIIVNDIIRDIWRKKDARTKKERKVGAELLASRCTIGVILASSAIISSLVPNTTINDLGFLSMGLRAAVVFVPMTCALFLKGRVNRKSALLSIIAAPVADIIGYLLKLPTDPLFLGIAAAAVVCIAGLIAGRDRENSLKA